MEEIRNSAALHLQLWILSKRSWRIKDRENKDKEKG